MDFTPFVKFPELRLVMLEATIQLLHISFRALELDMLFASEFQIFHQCSARCDFWITFFYIKQRPMTEHFIIILSDSGHKRFDPIVNKVIFYDFSLTCAQTKIVHIIQRGCLLNIRHKFNGLLPGEIYKYFLLWWVLKIRSSLLIQGETENNFGEFFIIIFKF